MNWFLRTLQNKKLAVATRLFLGAILFGAGMSKLYAEHAFPGIIGPVWLEERLAEYGLAFFARFVAFSQVIAGLLLLTQRFATLGAVISFPLFLNILMITISLEWQGTPYVNAVFLAMNTYLLAFDYHKLKYLILDGRANTDTKPRTDQVGDLVWLMGLVMIVLSIAISFLSISLAWSTAAAGLAIIAWNQIFRKKVKREETSSN